jgi:hypothetical protein
MTDTGTINTSVQPGGFQVVVSPSRLVRPIPPFLFAAPAGWVVDEAPGAIAVIRAPAAVEGFWDNALITHDRVARAVDLEAAAAASWGRLRADAPTAEVVTERVARFGSNVVYLRGVELDAPQSKRRLAQLHGICFAPGIDGAKTADLFQIVCTSTVENMEKGSALLFTELIASFQFV